ncbi:hypothetical protein DFH09DRAFT_942343 [Mycena vulgaris]|nr:hypothetical protein DFH09DRAFT_942343 [Mycena vulgaris]
MVVPPGILYLSRTLPVIALPSVATYVILSRMPQLQGSQWVPVFAAFLAQPVLFGLNIFYTSITTWMDVKRRGAVPIPQIPDRWPGGFTNLALLGKTLDSGYPAETFSDWFEQYGNTVLVRLLFEDRIGTTEPAYIKARTGLSACYYDYSSTCRVGIHIYSDSGIGVFNTDGACNCGRFHRSMTRPFFSRERITDFDIFDKHANDAIRQAAARLRQGYAVDIQVDTYLINLQNVASRFTLDSGTEFLFGKSVESLSAGLAYPRGSSQKNPDSFLNHPSNTFVDTLLKGQQVHVGRSRFGNKWPLTEFWQDRVKPHRQVIDQFIEPILNDALQDKARRHTEPEDSKPKADSLLSHLLETTEGLASICKPADAFTHMITTYISIFLLSSTVIPIC